jgi:hypothetical protein
MTLEQLEKWIENGIAAQAITGYAADGTPVRELAVRLKDLRALFDGKVLVPVEALNAVMELAGVALVYQPFGTKDRKHFDTLIQIAASQEQK